MMKIEHKDLDLSEINEAIKNSLQLVNKAKIEDENGNNVDFGKLKMDIENLFPEQKDIEKEYVDFVNDNFWDLI